MAKNKEKKIIGGKLTSSKQTTPTSNHSLFLDYNHIVQPAQFHYIHNPGSRVCKNRPMIIGYVHISFQNFDRRASIRELWSDNQCTKDLWKNIKSRYPFVNSFNEPIRIVFMLGNGDSELNQDRVDLEYNEYHDIVQQNFHDSYRNLTYKSIMAMQWLSEHCTSAGMILKLDDDIIINMFSLIRLVAFQLSSDIRNTIICYLHQGMPVIREVKSKWYVTKEEYPLSYYCPYCSGSAFLMTIDVPKILYNVSLYTPFYWVDDYYLTGLLVQKAKIIRFLSFPESYVFTNTLTNFKDIISVKSLFGHLDQFSWGLYKCWSDICQQNEMKCLDDADKAIHISTHNLMLFADVGTNEQYQE
ncbi:hypothetical protein SNEBB_005581, partial [Seison nebaliae]